MPQPDLASPTGHHAVADLLPGLGRPAERALAAAGYVRLDQLTDVAAADLLALHGVGPKAVSILRAALAEGGQTFAAEP